MAKTYSVVKISKSMIDHAYDEAQKLPKFEYSFRELQARYVGCLGELSLATYFNRKNVQFTDQRSNTTHDFRMCGGLTLDVKTKERAVKPKKHFENSVPRYNHEHQRPDYYYFVSLLRDDRLAKDDKYRFTEAYILGAISLDDLETVGIEWKKGSTDLRNGTTFWTDCINVTMEQLSENSEMLRLFGGVNDSDSPIRSVG